MITSNVIYRVFRLKVGDKAGTMFAIEVDGREYLVTAKHVVSSLQGQGRVEVFKEGGWSPLEVTTVGHAPGEVDISVLAPSEHLGQMFPLPASSKGLAYGQEAFFLGFPYDIDGKFLLDTGYPIPFVKRLTVSSLFTNPYLLDGHNNPGFSGGPVVFVPPGRKDFQVVAVISGYPAKGAPVVDQEGKDTELYFRENPGIVSAFGIEGAISLIKANPIGLAAGSA